MESHVQNQSQSPKQLSNKELLSLTKLLVQKERNIHIQVLRHLVEIDSRKLFFRQGFSSLFDYAVRELSYSEGAAYRRIKAMRLCQDLPETASRLQSGRLSLSTASQLQVFFEKQDKKVKEELRELSKKSISRSGREKQATNKEQTLTKTSENLKIGGNFQNEDLNKNLSSFPQSLSQKAKENLVQKAEGCSTRATERLLSEADPSLSLPKREQVRFLEKDKVEIKVVIDEQCHKELEKLKNLLSHRNPKLSYGELISILSKEAVKKHDPKEKNIRRKKEEKIQKKASSRQSELTDKSSGQLASASKSEESKPSREVSLSGGPVTSTKSGQINQDTKGKTTSSPKSGQKLKTINRYIPSYLRKYIWERDGSQCTYVHHETKHRCASRHLLQIDHIQPFALGGKTEKENLRLLCAGHNQYRR